MNTNRTPLTRKLSAAFLAAIFALGCAQFAASAITITTTNGSGAEVQLTGWNGPNTDPTNAVDSAANNDQLNLRTTTNRNEIAALRFDLTGFTPANNTNYTIQLVNQRANGAVTLFYYAVTDGTVGEDNNGSTPGYTDNTWVETNVLFSTMPGMHWANTSTLDQTVNANAVLLGSALMNTTAEGSLVSFTSQSLNDFMQTNADSVVTFLVLRTDSGGTQARFATKEATILASGGTGNAGDYAPRLKFSANGCDPAVVTTSPASQTVTVGSTALFTVVATGSTPTYQWQIKTNGTTTWFDIVGETGSSYTTPATITADSGNQYRCVVAVSCDTDTATSAAATLTVQALANWTGGASPDNSWTTGSNWDTGVAPGSGTNALIGTTFTINFTNPAALAFKSLTNGSTINVNTNGLTNTYTWGNVATAVLNINTGGQMGVGGDLALFTGAGISIAPGAALNVNRLIIGSGSTGGTGTGTANSYGRVTNNGGILISADTRLNAPNGTLSTSTATDASPLLVIKGGTNRLGTVSINRAAGSSSAANALGRDGLIVSNGLVEMTSLVVGNNQHGTVLIAGGSVTNLGSTTSTNSTVSRPSRFLQTGGTYVGAGNLIIAPSGTGQAIGSITGGTNIIGGIQLGAGAAGGTARFTNSASIYVGANGVSHNGVATIENRLNPGGLFGAQADWTGSAALTLGSGTFTFQAAALDGTPHNITYSSALGGTGPLAKTGAGTLTLGGTNTYSDKTYIREGTLALGAAGSLGSTEISLSTGTVFDVTATSYTLPALKTLSGYGVVTGNVAIASTGIINPGTNNTVAAAGTLTFANSLTQTGGALTHFDLSVNPSGPTNDVVVIGADLNVSGVNTLELNGGGPLGSVHPLFKYSGTFNGALTNFAVTGPSGYLTNLAGTPNIIAFVMATPVRAATNIVWVGNSGQNDWDIQNLTNWLNGASLDFFRNDDSVAFNGVGAANPNVNLAALLQPAAVVVDAAADYSFNGIGSITTGSLTKTNTGRLTIANTNTFNGALNINQGTVSVASITDDGIAGPLGQASTVTLNGGTLEYTATTASASRSILVGANGGAVAITDAGATLTLGGTFSGGGVLAKTGPGVLAVAGAANSYSGGTVVSNGTFSINALLGAGSGPITLQSGVTLSIASAFKPANSIVIAGPSIITGGNTGGSNGVSAVSGSADVVVAVKTGVFDLIGSLAGYSGTMTLSNAGGASLRFNGTTGSSLATFDLGVGTMDLMIRNGLQNVDIGALKGGASTTLSGRGGSSNNGPTTHHVGANGLSTTFDGIIQNGSGGGSSTTAIVKTGTGTLTLTGASTHTGNTTVSNGVLQVNGSLGSTAVTVDGGTLNGSGSLGGSVTVTSGMLAGGLNIAGSVIVQTGATIAPGASTGTLTVGALQLDAGSFTSMELDAANGTNDLITTVGTISYGGALNVTNLGGTLAAGQSYKLFNAANEFSYFGAFDGGTNLPALGAGLVWDTTGLATNGTISVVTAPITVNPTPTNIVNSVSGGVLTLSWPSDHIGWTLQTQTNSRSIGLVPATNAWFDVSGSDTTNQVDMPISPAQPTVFFRLRLPQ